LATVKAMNECDILQEFYQVTFRKKIYDTIEQL
jgi:hypothetical protein